MKTTFFSLFGLVLMGATTVKGADFVALGKLTVNDRETETITPEFLQTQIEILESGELRRRALDYTRATYPELKEADVHIKASRAKRSLIINVAATGDDAKYTRLFLDSLLQEYIHFRKEMAEKSISITMNKVIEEVISREKSVKQKSEALKLEGDVDIIEALRERTRKRIVDEVDDKKLNEHIGKMKEVCDKLASYRVAKSAYDQADADYQEWKANMIRLDASIVLYSDRMVILERPQIAVDRTPEVGGAMVGQILQAIFEALRR